MKSACRLSSILLSLGVLSSPALSLPLAEFGDRQLVQAVDPLCRQVREDVSEGLTIRLDPSPFSRAIANVPPGGRLQLAPNYSAIRGPEGNNWIQVAFPADGYINNGPAGRSNLVYCQAFMWGDRPMDDPAPRPPVRPTPPRRGTACRRVIEEEGLVVRSAPSTESAVIGGVDFNQEVFITLPIRPVAGDDGRDWIEIASPFRGYVSNGYGQGVSNLGGCL